MPPCARVFPLDGSPAGGALHRQRNFKPLKELKLLEAYGLDELTGPFEALLRCHALCTISAIRRLVILRSGDK